MVVALRLPAAARAPTDALVLVSPHPDDESILAGATIHRTAADRSTLVWAIYMSGGDRASLPGPCHGIPERTKARRIVRLRERETRAAWAVLAPGRRVPLRFLRGPDQRLVASSTLVDGVRADVFSPAGVRAITRAVGLMGRLPRSLRRVTLITAARYDAHGDHRAAYAAARQGAERLAARGSLTVRLWTFIVHDEIATANVPVCCLGDFHWPGPGPTHDRALLTDFAARPRPPAWPLVLPVEDAAIRREAISRHVSQVVGYPALCMVDFVPKFYANWWDKREEPFYEEVFGSG